MIKDYVKLAYSSARKRKIRSWLTMIGIFIGIAAVVAILSLSQGLEDAVLAQFSGLGSDTLFVQAAGSGFGPPGTATAEPLTEKNKDDLADVKGVDQTMGRLIRTAQLEFEDEVKFNYLLSMPKESDERAFIDDVYDYEIVQGDMFDPGAQREVVIPEGLAENFFEETMELRDRLLIQGEEFKIVGIVKKTGDPRVDNSFVIPEKTMREILSIEDEIDFIALRVEAGEEVAAVGERVEEELRDSRGVEEGKENFEVQVPQDLIETLNSILGVIQGALVGIAGISLLVGGIGIMNTMYTSVYERTKEIAIMKAIGAKPREVLLLFVLESGMLGAVGGIIGIAIGFSISFLVELIARQALGENLLQANFGVEIFIGALAFSFLVGAISGALPAYQASRMAIVDGFRR